jgi:hypothetical protein
VLAQAFTATRRDERISIIPARSELAQGTGSPLTDLYSSAVALADRVTAAAAGLHIAPFARMPERSFDAFWREFGDAVPELGTIATVLRLKMYAMDGDEIAPPAEETQDGALRLSLDLYIDGAEVAFDFADVVARMTHTPRQRRRVEVVPDELSGLGQLSRYEAEAAVDARGRLSSAWLLGLLASGSGSTWGDFVRSPAAAPVLRAATRELDRSQTSRAVAEAVPQLLENALEVIDIDTASAFAVLCHQGNGADICARLLDVIVEKCDRGAWSLLDIPVQTWEGLADLFRSADPVIGVHRAKFLMLLESAVTESLAGVADDDLRGVDALAPFWVQALRIGAVNNQERILQAITDRREFSAYITVQESRYLMSLAGWAREAGDPSLVLPVMRSPRGSVWLGVLGPSADDWIPGAVDDVAVARLLTHREAMDFRWALEALRQAGEEEEMAAEARRGKWRRA